MAELIRIEVASTAEGADLSNALAVRGLNGVLVDTSEGYWLEISSRHEETDRLMADVAAALRAWLADRHRDAITVQVGDRFRRIRASEAPVPRARRNGRPRDPAFSATAGSRTNALAGLEARVRVSP